MCRCRVVPVPGPTTRRSMCRCRIRWRSTSTAGSGSPTSMSGRVRSIELKNWVATLTLDLESDGEAAHQHAGQDRADQPAGFPARSAGCAAGSVVAAAEVRRHDSVEERVGVPDHRAGAGQHRHDPAPVVGCRTWRRFRPRSTTCSPGVPTRSGSSWAGWTRSPTSSTSSATTSPGRSIRPTGCCRSSRERNNTLDRVLTEFPPLIKHFADTRDLFADAVERAGPYQRCRRRRDRPGQRQPEHQPGQPAAAAARTGQGGAVPDRRAEAAAHGAVQHRERAEGGARRLHQRLAHSST